MKFNIFISLIFFQSFLYAQQLQVMGDFTVKGIVFSGEDSPFWFHSNQRGRMNEINYTSTLFSSVMTYHIEDNASFRIGGGLLYQDGHIDKLQLDESFLSFDNSYIEIFVGRKHHKELYKGLSATNKNILWSMNARPLPGIGFKTLRPLYFWKNAGLGIQTSYEEYITDDDRYVKDTRVHHKSLHLVFDKINKIEFSLGLEHFVQWGGTSPEFGRLPGGFKDYINVVMGKEGSDGVGGEEVNALGNHLGSYVAGIKTSLDYYNVEIIYNHIFEDGSGRRLGNTPDGRYGIYVEDKEPGKWVDALMYEFYYTKHQSFTSSGTDGTDNYFNNNLYRSGWTYENRVIGLPFITLDDERFRIDNNKIIAHHIGISGLAISKYPYKLLTSYRMNYGAKGGSDLRYDVLSTYLDVNVYRDILNVNVLFGADFSTINQPNFGVGVQLTKFLF